MSRNNVVRTMDVHVQHIYNVYMINKTMNDFLPTYLPRYLPIYVYDMACYDMIWCYGSFTQGERFAVLVFFFGLILIWFCFDLN